MKEFNASKKRQNQNDLDEKCLKPSMIGTATMLTVYGLTQNFESCRETLGAIIVSEEYSLPNQDALFYVSSVIAIAGAFSIFMMLIITRFVLERVDDRKFFLFAGLLPLFIITLFNQPMSGTKMITHNCSKNSQGNYVFNLTNKTYGDRVVTSNSMPIEYISNFERKVLKRPEENSKRHSFYTSNQTHLIQNEDAQTYLQRATGLVNKSDEYLSSANFLNKKISINKMTTISNNALDFEDGRYTEQYSQENFTIASDRFRLFIEQNAGSNESSDSCLGCPVLEQPWCAHTSYVPVVQMVLVYSLAVTPEIISLTMFQGIYAKILGESN